jgi:copper homeostasis protein
VKCKAVEVIASSLEDAKTAKKAGADRIELCSSVYPAGGLTPSLGLLESIIESNLIQTACMIRPRGAGFCYWEDEFQTMLLDAKHFSAAGANALVFGFLNKDFTPNIDYTNRFVDIIKSSYPKIECVFHRAFDLTPNADNAIEQLIDCNIDRVLTSGHKKSAVDGAEEIKHLQRNYSSNIQILAGSGLRADNVKEFINFTGVSQVHAGGHLWKEDSTTSREEIDYSYLSSYKDKYNFLDLETCKKFVKECKNI